jgi:2-C-methyl-D-erythritol 2,4-cyclodiphosphate synthase
MRIGFGYDVHRLVRGRKLILGGVEVPYERGLLGHSDADVLIHAICDALLGSIAGGDIGINFPDSDPEYKEVSSIKLLQTVRGLIAKKLARVKNIDSTIVAEEPKLQKFVPEMRKNIADALEIDFSRVSIKATTPEGLGFIGRGEGMAAYAVVLITS